VVRDAARAAGKEVELVITGKEMELDRSLLDAMADPLVHLLRNAVDHGIEPGEEREGLGKPRAGRVELEARRERSRVVIVVRDDGRGIDREAVIARARREGLLDEADQPSDEQLFRIVARPGFSTAGEVTTLSGRGVGLNVVEEIVRGLGGSVELESEAGVGTRVRLELPLTLAIVPALIVRVSGQLYALPATFTRESFELSEAEVERAHGAEWVTWRDRRVPLVRLARLFANGSAPPSPVESGSPGVLKLVALDFGGRRAVVAVDGFQGEEEVVVKPFDTPRGTIPVFAGATVRPDGRPALVLDAGRLTEA
jgi:two-component system chemotaxis sensor kinase CheA